MNPKDRLTLAKINLKLAKDWSHTTPSVKQDRIAECHEEINQALADLGY